MARITIDINLRDIDPSGYWVDDPDFALRLLRDHLADAVNEIDAHIAFRDSATGGALIKNPDGRTVGQWAWDPDDHCTHPNCERHGKSPCEGINCWGEEGNRA